MDKETTVRGLMSRDNSSNKEILDLYRILQKTKVSNNILFKAVDDVLSFIDEESFEFKGEITDITPEVFSKLQGISSQFIDIILKFLVSEDMIEINNKDLELTPGGRLFLLSDEISCSIDLIRYFWSKLDWDSVSNKRTFSKFLKFDARRYVACLLTQLENGNPDINILKEKYGHIDDIYFNNFFIIKELLEDEGMYFILENIFEPLGLIVINKKSEEKVIKLTKRGKMVFEYYSCEMMKEYTELIEECWECYDRGNFQQAYEMARNVISVTSSILDAYNVIGCVYIRQGEYDKAKDIFMFAIDLCQYKMGEVNNGEETVMEIYVSMYYNLGLCFFYMGNYMRALNIFTSIKKTLPYNMESLEVIMKTIRKILIAK